MPFQFLFPAALLLLLFLPFFVYRWMGPRDLGPFRRWWILVLRLVVAVLLVLSLAGFQYRTSTEVLSVIFALDPLRERAAR